MCDVLSECLVFVEVSLASLKQNGTLQMGPCKFS